MPRGADPIRENPRDRRLSSALPGAVTVRSGAVGLAGATRLELDRPVEPEAREPDLPAISRRRAAKLSSSALRCEVAVFPTAPSADDSCLGDGGTFGLIWLPMLSGLRTLGLGLFVGGSADDERCHTVLYRCDRIVLPELRDGGTLGLDGDRLGKPSDGRDKLGDRLGKRSGGRDELGDRLGELSEGRDGLAGIALAPDDDRDDIDEPRPRELDGDRLGSDDVDRRLAIRFASELWRELLPR